MIETQKQVVPIRTPESAFRGDVVRVLGADGRADPKSDPRLPHERVIDIYRAMTRARLVDAQLEKLQRQGRIGFHVGALGEEAAVVGAAAALSAEDWIFPCYRELAALLYRGFPLERYVDNMFGNADDPVKGRQMPDHYTARHLRYGSVSSPIGTQITHAVGLAYGIKKRGEREVAAVFFGDGATSSNDFHAGMNFAGVWKVPVLFLLRNNRWAISLPSEKQTAAKALADKAAGYGVPAIRCDGNDALAVFGAVRGARERALRGEGASLVELVTYRRGSHSTSDDPRAYRDESEVSEWSRMDPVARLEGYLRGLGAWGDAEQEALEREVTAELKACIALAEKKPKPALATIFEGVYAETPWHLREQREECERGRRPDFERE
jgi:2-oxoisovalerate dehydrogenase E1 component alpha subunit